MAAKDPDDPILIDEVQARQGVTGHNVRIVLFVGAFLAVVCGIILYFSVGRPA